MNHDEQALDDFLTKVSENLHSKDFVKLTFGELANLTPYYDEEYELSSESITYIATHFEKHFIDSEPRIRKGFIKHNIDSPIFLHKCDGTVDHTSNSYRHGFLMVRLAVMMSIIDGIVDSQEMNQIRKMIWNMEFLSSTSKASLFAKANLYMCNDSELDKEERTYKRIAINRKKLIEKIALLSESSANSLVKVAQDIAVADGFIDREELTFLQDIYRALGKSARFTKGDLKRYAESKRIDVEDLTTNKLIPEVELDEFDNVLDDLLLDYDDF